MKKILILLGHPDTASLCGGIADSYEKGAKKSKYQVKRIDIGNLKFDPILHNGYNKIQPLETTLINAQKNLIWADHIVWIFPCWWSSFPAIMKGFLDRVFLPGFAYKYTDQYSWKRLLKNKTSRIITTMGGPTFYYFGFFQNPAIKSLKKGTLEFCGIKPIHITTFGNIRKSMNTKRVEKILDKVKALGSKGK